MSIRTWIADKICGIETMIPGTEEYYFWRTEQQFHEMAKICSKMRVNTEEIDREIERSKNILKAIEEDTDYQVNWTLSYIDEKGETHEVECPFMEDYDKAFDDVMHHPEYTLIL